MKTVYFYVQGEGAREVTINSETTLQEVVDSNGWSHFSVTVNDAIVVPSNWSTTKLWTATEVWLTQGAKGA